MGDRMNTCGVSILLVVKAKLLERKLFKRFLWIQYTEALQDGKVYTPPPTPEDPHPWPWIGIDRYPNTIHRKDKLPYSSLPEEQDACDWGMAYGGRIKGLYTHQDADSIFVDWPSTGGQPSWGHYSVLTLIGRGWSGKEWSLGSLMWRYSVDASGKLKECGARPANAEDCAKWLECVRAGNQSYMAETFAGDWQAA